MFRACFLEPVPFVLSSLLSYNTVLVEQSLTFLLRLLFAATLLEMLSPDQMNRAKGVNTREFD